MHVFFATDGSPSALTAERVLATFPFDGPPRLTIATVCPAADLHAISSDVTSPVTEMLDRCRTDAAKLLVDAADRCKAWTPKIDRLLLDGHPAEELLKAINRLYPDVVVVGARGLGAVKRMLLGSVSERIVKHRLTQMLGGDPHEFQPTSDHEWKIRPEQSDNHWLDCVVGNRIYQRVECISTQRIKWCARSTVQARL